MRLTGGLLEAVAGWGCADASRVALAVESHSAIARHPPPQIQARLGLTRRRAESSQRGARGMELQAEPTVRVVKANAEAPMRS